MVEVKVILDFACAACGQSVQVTLKCAGPKLALHTGLAAVEVPCPHCRRVSQVCFAPNGTVRSVRAAEAGGLPRPSWN
jgi:hypothetical protein